MVYWDLIHPWLANLRSQSYAELQDLEDAHLVCILNRQILFVSAFNLHRPQEKFQILHKINCLRNPLLSSEFQFNIISMKLKHFKVTQLTNSPILLTLCAEIALQFCALNMMYWCTFWNTTANGEQRGACGDGTETLPGPVRVDQRWAGADSREGGMDLILSPGLSLFFSFDLCWIDCAHPRIFIGHQVAYPEVRE